MDFLEELRAKDSPAPTPIADDVAAAAAAEPPAKPPSGPKRILVVDDDVAILVFCRAVLEDEGFAVDVAETGAEALLRFRRHRPDLVLLDLNLPGIDGIEVCSRLTGRDEAGLRYQARAAPGRTESPVRTPILFVTSTTTPDAVRRAVEAGAAGYVAKPLTTDDLLQRVRRALGDPPATAT